MWSLKGRGLIVMVTLGISAATNIATVVTFFAIKDYLQAAADGALFDQDHWEQLIARSEQLRQVQVIVFVVSAVAFLTWFHRAAANLRGGGLTGLTYSPGWAVCGFLVPIMWFFRPFQVMREVWRGSAKLGGELPDGEEVYGPAPLLVVLWWVAFVASRLIEVFARQAGNRAQEVDEIVNSLWLSIAAVATTVIAAFLAASVVRRVTEMQQNAIELRAEARMEGASDAEPPPISRQAAAFDPDTHP